MKRTIPQNKSLHKLFDDISRECNNQGIDQKTLLEDLTGYEAPVTPEFIKEVWKSIMWTMYRTTSTTQLESHQYSEVYDVFNKFLAEQYGIHCPLPSIAGS